jgi:hypothetical protein
VDHPGAAHVRPLDDLTHRLLLEWLDYRRTRWPYTANPHLIINNQTAHERTPASAHWIGDGFRGARHPRTLTRRPPTRGSPHARSVVFGLDEMTTIRYTASARQLLKTEIEDHTPS